MIEAINVGDSAAGAVGGIAAVSASLPLSGYYTGVCRGYRAEHMAEYLREFPRLSALREQVGRMTAEARAYLVAFELYMESLTEVKWADTAPNVVTTPGGNLALDTLLKGNAYTVTGPFMLLIGAVSYTGVPVIGDTMASHGTWTEAGTTNAPTYTAPRKTITFSSASAKISSIATAPVFGITGTGTAKGVGLVLGSGAVSTIDSTLGTLYSAGLFSGGDQAVVNTNTLTVTYTATA